MGTIKTKRKKKQKTQLQKDIQKEKTRLKRLIKKYEKQGFDVTFEIPEQKRNTKQYLEKMQSINYIQVLQKSYKVDVKSGAIVSGWGLRVNPKKYKDMDIQSYTGKGAADQRETGTGTDTETTDDYEYSYDYDDDSTEYYDEDYYNEDDLEGYQLVITNFKGYLASYPQPLTGGLIKQVDNWVQRFGEAIVATVLYQFTWNKLDDYLRTYPSTQAIQEYSNELEELLEQEFQKKVK